MVGCLFFKRNFRKFSIFSHPNYYVSHPLYFLPRRLEASLRQSIDATLRQTCIKRGRQMARPAIDASLPQTCIKFEATLHQTLSYRWEVSRFRGRIWRSCCQTRSDAVTFSPFWDAASLDCCQTLNDAVTFPHFLDTALLQSCQSQSDAVTFSPFSGYRIARLLSISKRWGNFSLNTGIPRCSFVVKF